MSDTPRTDAVVNSLPQNDRGEITLKGIRNLINCCAELERELAEVTKQRDEAIRRQGGPDIMEAVTVIDTINGLLERAGITGDKTTQRKVMEMIAQRDTLVEALQACVGAGGNFSDLIAASHVARRALAAVKGGGT